MANRQRRPVPSSPNPTSGRLYFVPTTRCIRLEMSPQEALKLLISGGYSIRGSCARYAFTPSQSLVPFHGWRMTNRAWKLVLSPVSCSDRSSPA